MTEPKLSIAVVGGGVAGIVAAHLLSKRHDVTLFEANEYVGGHTNTIVLQEGPDAGTPVDTGFIVLNDKTYPLLHRFLQELNVPVRFADMSFGYWNKASGLMYSGKNISTLFAQRGNLFRPRFWKLLLEISRFGENALRDLESQKFQERSLGRYLEDGKYSRPFIEDYILPMGAAIWSTPLDQMLDFPAVTFARFFRNHGLLSLKDRPRWQTVIGGSHQYVHAFLKSFPGEVRKATPIESVRREEAGIRVQPRDGQGQRFDRVVIAAHADQALSLLEDPSPEEKRLLGPWSYKRNATVLHTDLGFMPPNQRAWASWNYLREPDSSGQVSLTYDMTNLQGLRTHNRYLVTLNAARPYGKNRIIRELSYTHPVYTYDAVRTQESLPALNGKRGTYFCGSYFGYGFHEDAVRSAVSVAKAFGLDL